MSASPVVTRFAPSPTGYLHIGGARTALFNWLFARHHGGRFLLRIEDTDRARSTEAAVAAILDGLTWLELDWDGEAVFQFARAKRHAEVAHDLVARGGAYRCYATTAELEEMRAAQKAANLPQRYDGRWRDRDPADAPPGAPYVVRLKAPNTGATVIADRVQGEVTVENAQLDDMVLLRADGTPTYMLSVVVDDHDMAVTHVIRGDDHLTNAFRQTQLYRACGWTVPTFAHLPLIHGPDGAKLSKRHGALGVDAYRDMGYLPAALRNYLLRLGWAHGDAEIISTAQAIAWFDIDAVGRSPARIDFAKLANVNAHYLRAAPDADLATLVAGRLAMEIGRPLVDAEIARLRRAVAGLKPRAQTVAQMAEGARFILDGPAPPADAKAAQMLAGDGQRIAVALAAVLAELSEWRADLIEAAVRDWCAANARKLGDAAQPMRAALTGSVVSPPVFDVADVLGRAITLARLGAAA
jgi:glutamyl-tRNA synthetase